MTSNSIINVFGAMTTGKSTLVEHLQAYIDRIYTVDYDVVKKQISGFYSSRDREISTKITYDTLASVAETGLDILALLPPPENYEVYSQVERIARSNEYEVINIELVAPLDILVERYEQRLQALQNAGEDITKLRTVEEFKETVQKPYFKPEEVVTLDSSKLSPEEIFEQVKNLL